LKIEGRKARWLVAFGFHLLNLLGRTLRYEIDDRAGIVGRPVANNFIGALWHNRLLIFPLVLRRFFRHRGGAPLISASRDGDMIANWIERAGYGTIRGSSSRKGVAALRQLMDTLAANGNVLFTPDGPRGPVYQVSQGVVFLAQKSGAPIVPIHMEYSSCWRLKSWDRFVVPRPFATLRAIFGAPIRIPPLDGPEQFAAEQLRLQTAMMSLVEQP
jgi:lysophospholipid acyltransferase (LPLAT)-like uncharacterized protein